MKCSLPWQLFSSAIFFSISSFSLLAETPLGAMDNYNGHIATEDFEPKKTNNANGTTYFCIGDLSIVQAGGEGNVLPSACFQEEAGNLTFHGNGFSMSFGAIDVNPTFPSAINVSGTNKALTIQGFSHLSFSSATKGKGAINSTGTFLLTNNDVVNFSYNTSTVTGGAAFSTGNCTISNNGIVCFSNNKASGNNSDGAAIWCAATNQTTLSIQGNSEVSFINNSTTGSGGAIYAKKLSLTTSKGKGMLFANNSVVNNATTKSGGAIAIAESGSLNLTADGSDIVFDGNKVIRSGQATRNAIHMDSNAKYIALRATKDNAIFFYDPVTGTATVNSILNLNHPDTNSPQKYTGAIVFSGEKLSKNEANNADNLKSMFKQQLTLSAGTLVLKDGVTLQARTFTQTAGSQVILNAGTTLETYEHQINLNGLAVNLASYDLREDNTAKLKTTNTNAKSITISNPIVLLDENGMFYENHNLIEPQSLKLLHLSTAQNKTVIYLQKLPTSPNVAPHYGHQGTWKLSFSTASSSGGRRSQEIIAAWEKTGYIPHPERRGNLVPNSLWGVYVDIHSIQEVMKRSTATLNERGGIWASAIGNFFHRDNVTDSSGIQQGFRHLSRGYVVGIRSPTIANTILNLAFCNLFGRDKDRIITKNHITSYAGSLNFQHEGKMDYFTYLFPERFLKGLVPKKLPIAASLNSLGSRDFSLHALVTYCHNNNDMKTTYTKLTLPEVPAAWRNHGVGMEMGGKVVFPVQRSPFATSCSPFVKVQLTYAYQENFKESGNEARSFESSELYNFGIPVGMQLENTRGRSSFSLSLAYVPDVIRHDPKCLTTLIMTGDSWKIFGAHLARHALLVRLRNHYILTRSLEMFCQGNFEFRGSSKNYNVNLGSTLHF